MKNLKQVRWYPFRGQKLLKVPVTGGSAILMHCATFCVKYPISTSQMTCGVFKAHIRFYMVPVRY